MELHKHGKIWAESEGEGFGCTFFVQLPLHSLHYVAPTGYTKRGSLELPSFSLGATSMKESNREARHSYDSTTTINSSGLLESGKTKDKQASLSTRTDRYSYESNNTTNGNGWSEHGLNKNKQSSLSFDWSEDGLIDETDSKHSKGRNTSSLSTLLQPTAVAMDAWKPTILVVDDSKMNRKMLVRMLISKGFACREAEDGMEGLSEMSRVALPSKKATRMSFSLLSGMFLCCLCCSIS